MKSFVQFVSCKSTKSVETTPTTKPNPNCSSKTHTQSCHKVNQQSRSNLNPSSSNRQQLSKPQTIPLKFDSFTNTKFTIPLIMPQNFEDKIVLVTGSSGGIGAATIKYFAKAGAKVVVNGRNQNNIASVAAECDALSPKSKRIYGLNIL